MQRKLAVFVSHLLAESSASFRLRSASFLLSPKVTSSGASSSLDSRPWHKVSLVFSVSALFFDEAVVVPRFDFTMMPSVVKSSTCDLSRGFKKASPREPSSGEDDHYSKMKT